MRIDILTLFPEMFASVFSQSIVKRAGDKGKLQINIVDLRNYASDSYKTVDDKPYGGGAGMIMKVDIIDKAVADIKAQSSATKIKTTKVILTDAGGRKYTQKKAFELSGIEHLIIICGHYEGVDYRVHEHIADEIISVGDYVLSGGEIPAMIIIDSVVRLLPQVLGNSESLSEESHNNEGETEYPQYTRPEEYKGWSVPKVLLEGNHKLIAEWRKSTCVSPDEPARK